MTLAKSARLVGGVSSILSFRPQGSPFAVAWRMECLESLRKVPFAVCAGNCYGCFGGEALEVASRASEVSLA